MNAIGGRWETARTVLENVAAAGLDVIDIGCIAAECVAWITEFGGNEAEMRDDE